MKKLALLTVLLCIASLRAAADDIITKIDGEQIRAKITEVSSQDVKFKRLDNPNGPVYVLGISEISSIVYENGFVEKYNEPLPEPEPEPRYEVERYDVSYGDIAHLYNPYAYRARIDDPYSPAGAGVASFFIPGLGQCIDGEWGRGAGIFAANVGFCLLESTELSLLFYSAANGSSYYRKYGEQSYRSNTLMYGSLCAALLTYAGHLAFNIWNIVDAVNIAKVKNMYYQDRRDAPTLALSPAFGIGAMPNAGLSLTLSF